MPVTRQWLPIEDSFEQQLVERLVRDGRAFVKGLRYNLPVGKLLASVILTDAGESLVALCIAPRDADDEQMVAEMKDLMPITGSPAWVSVDVPFSQAVSELTGGLQVCKVLPFDI